MLPRQFRASAMSGSNVADILGLQGLCGHWYNLPIWLMTVKCHPGVYLFCVWVRNNERKICAWEEKWALSHLLYFWSGKQG